MSPLLYPGSDQQKRDELRNAAKAQLVASAEALPKTAGPVSSLGVVGGWVPASSANVLAEKLDSMAMTAEKLYDKLNASDQREYAALDVLRERMSNYRSCASDVRRLVADATVRQPAPNTPDQTRI